MKREPIDKVIELFKKGIELINREYYVDAIHKFNMLIDDYPESDLADDALYNVGLCYFKMKQFELAIETFYKVIFDYPNAEISVLENEFGKTDAKCYYSIFLSHLALGQKEKAAEIKLQLKDFSNDNYIDINNERKTYFELSDMIMNEYEHK